MSETQSSDSDVGSAGFEAEDPSHKIQHARVQSILQARKRVDEKKDEAQDFVQFGEIKPEGKDRIIRNAVEAYIRQLRWLMEGAETEADYLNEIELGEVQLPTRTIKFTGVLSILDAPKSLQDTWEETDVDPYEGRQRVERSVSKPIPERMLMNAFDACNMFCQEVGLDVKLAEDSEKDAEFDYSDLLEEGPPGHEQSGQVEGVAD